MSERDGDLALLRMFGGSKDLSQSKFLMSVGAWLFLGILGSVSASLGKHNMIFIASISWPMVLLVCIQYYLVGPLCREIKRLRYELDMLRT